MNRAELTPDEEQEREREEQLFMRRMRRRETWIIGASVILFCLIWLVYRWAASLHPN
jgi:hypothetical protein